LNSSTEGPNHEAAFAQEEKTARDCASNIGLGSGIDAWFNQSLLSKNSIRIGTGTRGGGLLCSGHGVAQAIRPPLSMVRLSLRTTDQASAIMTSGLRIALTADVHWRHNSEGDAATLALRDFLRNNPPDVLLLAGDLGTANHFKDCLELFADIPCVKALVPGNHDVWVENPDVRGDSLTVYHGHLPHIADEYDFHYLDEAPLFLDGTNLAVVGTMNWYDYSWSMPKLKEHPGWEDRLREKRFNRGRHNDARFVRWATDDVSFTRQTVQAFARHMDQVVAKGKKALVVTHHPAFHGLGFPRPTAAATWDSLLWDALSGNRAMEEVLQRNAEHIPWVFSGHTHRNRENHFGPIAGFNIGGDYRWKRLMMLTWPAGSIEPFLFDLSEQNTS
jgi:predicted phosphohydrolase